MRLRIITRTAMLLFPQTKRQCKIDRNSNGFKNNQFHFKLIQKTFLI